MTLWIDVTDLYHWRLGHLTGIQRTSASVISELIATRRDVAFFAYDPSAQVLRKVDIQSLPEVVRRHIGGKADIVPGNAIGNPIAIAVHSHRLRDVYERTRRYLGQRLYFLKPSVRRLRSFVQRQKVKWASRETIDAVKDFRRSGRNLLGLIWRHTIGRERTAQSMMLPLAGPITLNETDLHP